MPPTTNNWDFVIAAYVVAWVALGGYWLFVHRAVRQARARYDQAIASAAKLEGSSK
jgi:hypothetical protein